MTRINRSQIALATKDFGLATKDVQAVMAVTKPPERNWATALLIRSQIHHAEKHLSDRSLT